MNGGYCFGDSTGERRLDLYCSGSGQPHRHLISCLATRTLGWLAHAEHLAGRLQQCRRHRSGKGPQQRADHRRGQERGQVGRYLSRAQLTYLDRACISENATPTQCRKVALRLYRSLPPEVTQKVRPKPCAALSPDAWQHLHPNSPCAKRAAP
jgi:hypothetical protein